MIELQSIFYIVAITALTLFIITLLAVLYLVFYIKNLIVNTQRRVVDKFVEITRPVDIVRGAGESLFNRFVGNKRFN